MLNNFPLDLILFFAVLLNPFSQVIFLWPLMRDTPVKTFTNIYFKASALSYGVYIFFSFFGDLLMTRVFKIQLSSLEIFGGIIILVVAFRYILGGAGSNVFFSTEAEDLPSEIALPYLVGPATIWVCILVGQSDHSVLGMASIGGVIALNWALVSLICWWIHHTQLRKESMWMKYFAILMRTNSLFIGAIGVEMILKNLPKF